MKYLHFFEYFADSKPIELSSTGKKEISYVDKQKQTLKRFRKNMKTITTENAVDFVLENCKEYLESPFLIQRGIFTKDDWNPNLFHSLPALRYSRDNKNYYNLLMDNGPEWKGYPKRMKSFMCGRHVSLGNDVYIVIPVDGSKWGVAPTGDIFQAFRLQTGELFGKPWDIDTILKDLDYYSDYFGIPISDTNFKEFKKSINIIGEKLLINSEYDDELERINTNRLNCYGMYQQIIEGVDFFELLLEVIDPTHNGFKLLSWEGMYEEFANPELPKEKLREEHEVWTNSECLFVKKYSNESYKFWHILLEKTGKDYLKLTK